MKENRKWILSILFVVLFLITIDVSASTITDSGIWQVINKDTITQVDTSLNVQIGENISTLEKFRVTGSSEFNGTVVILGQFNANSYASFNGLETSFYNTVQFKSGGNVFFNDNVEFNDTVIFNENVEFKQGITRNGYDVAFLPVHSALAYTGSSSDFNSNGYLINDTSWHMCNGLNSTTDMRDYFLVGAGNIYAQNSTGGNSSLTIVPNNLPRYVSGITVTKTAYNMINGLVSVVTNVANTTQGLTTPTKLNINPVYRGLYYIEFMGYT